MASSSDVLHAPLERASGLAVFVAAVALSATGVHADAPRVTGMPLTVLVVQAGADTFNHQRHSALSCLNCHTTQAGHGRLTFEVPRGCQLCHHQAPDRLDCSTCHAMQTAEPMPVTVTPVVADAPPRPRPVAFDHTTHAELSCRACHVTAVTLAPSEAARTCRDCHADHHEAGRSCSTCHVGAAVRDAHQRPAEAHVRCDACHTPATVSRLNPDRSFCATCHQPQSGDHYLDRECTTCHMLTTPDGYRRWLTGGAP